MTQKPHRSRQTYRPTEAEIIAVVRSLYEDRLKPLGRYLLIRLREHAQAISRMPPGSKIEPRQLRLTCEASRRLRVESEEGREFTVLLVDQPINFVDVTSMQNLYPREMWLEAAAYFTNLSGDDFFLPGGVYNCARELALRRPAFLNGYTFGEVCHIVQLSISQAYLLGFLENRLVPYQYSQKCVKRPSTGRPCQAWLTLQADAQLKCQPKAAGYQLAHADGIAMQQRPFHPHHALLLGMDRVSWPGGAVAEPAPPSERIFLATSLREAGSGDISGGHRGHVAQEIVYSF